MVILLGKIVLVMFAFGGVIHSLRGNDGIVTLLGIAMCWSVWWLIKQYRLSKTKT